MVPALRPRLMHWPVNAWFTTAGSVPAMRLSTVLAACAPSGIAAWQLIRSGESDGADASPAATMYGLSTLVSVSSVSSRPIASVARPLRAARSGTPNPAVQIVTALGSSRPSASTHRVLAHLGDRGAGPVDDRHARACVSRLATDRRAARRSGTGRARRRTPA